MGMSASSGGSDEPMGEMNTTPLIDVMLVLLIMFIITLPKPTDSVPIDLPADCKATNTCPDTVVEPKRNVLYISAYNQTLWNGVVIEQAQLLRNLQDSNDPKLFPVTPENPAGLPELVFDPDPQAKFDVVQKTIKLIKIAKVTKMGFARNGSFIGEIK